MININILSGQKTYIAAVGIIAIGIGGFLTGDLTLIEAITQVLAGLGLGALRFGVANK